jgi:RimJ/RimL family protein N-acetyltransferase
MTPEIFTERLLLKPLERRDADAIQTAFPRWEIVRYLTAAVPWPYPEGAAKDYIDNVALPAAREGRGWSWSLRLKEDPEVLIGLIELRDVENDNRGFWLIPEYQNHGYMTEACHAINDFWFRTLGREVMRVPKAALNTGSINISLKSGMRLIKTGKKEYVAGILEYELWEITRDEWCMKD